MGNHHIGVIGLGYVGLPLALLLVNKGYQVTGIDTDQQKISKLLASQSYLTDIQSIDIKGAKNTGRFKVSNDYDSVKKLNTIIICVPTPLTSSKKPELKYLKQVGESLSSRIQNDQLIILESSTFPGTTKEVLKPILEKNGMKVGADFYLGYSPERIDPAKQDIKVEQIPKVISGVTDECLVRITNLYNNVFDEVVPVTSPDVAEFTKLLENSYRLINISFINEMAMLCDSLNIDLWEAIEAASTKPYGFTRFNPGPGIGGHCIPVDPLYLKWKGKEAGFKNYMIDIADRINGAISDHIVKRVCDIWSVKNLSKKKIFIYGVSYKKDVNDVRESHAIPIIRKLSKLGADIQYNDPLVDEIKIDKHVLKNTAMTQEELKNTDCVLILTDHSSIPVEFIIEHASIVFDTRNVTQNYYGNAKVFRLGGGEL